MVDTEIGKFLTQEPLNRFSKFFKILLLASNIGKNTS